MDKHTFDKLHIKPQLKRATTKLYPYGAKQPLKLCVANLICSWNRVTATQMPCSTLLLVTVRFYHYETSLDLNILSEVNSVKEIHDIIDKNLKDTSHGIGTCIQRRSSEVTHR